MPELTHESAYQAAVRSLYERINYEKTGHAPYSDANYRLDRMRRLLSHLGDPHLAAPVIHIAGTKGKGSTATLIASMLSGAGYRTGLYTSPHLVHLEERFQVDGVPCTQDELTQLVEQLRGAAERVERDGAGRPTFFELTTALACLHFIQHRAQVVVLEVGLGGRLDSTNVCQPAVTVITTIGMDHQAQLGNTISEIAGEKAGIIKPGVPVVTSARHPDAQAAIMRQAAQQHAPLRMIDRDFVCSWSPVVADQSAPTTCATAVYCPMYDYSAVGPSRWSLSMLGRHHSDNLAAALCAMDCLSQQGWAIPYWLLADAVSSTIVPARLQIVGHKPLRLIDTAHNPDSIAAMLAALKEHYPHARPHFVLATSRDKDVEAMLKLLAPAAARLILTQYHNNPRGLPLEDLEQALLRVCPTVDYHIAPTPVIAWQQACQLAGPNEVVCATGSFFQAAELLADAVT